MKTSHHDLTWLFIAISPPPESTVWTEVVTSRENTVDDNSFSHSGDDAGNL